MNINGAGFNSKHANHLLLQQQQQQHQSFLLQVVPDTSTSGAGGAVERVFIQPKKDREKDGPAKKANAKHNQYDKSNLDPSKTFDSKQQVYQPSPASNQQQVFSKASLAMQQPHLKMMNIIENEGGYVPGAEGSSSILSTSHLARVKSAGAGSRFHINARRKSNKVTSSSIENDHNSDSSKILSNSFYQLNQDEKRPGKTKKKKRETVVGGEDPYAQDLSSPYKDEAQITEQSSMIISTSGRSKQKQGHSNVNNKRASTCSSTSNTTTAVTRKYRNKKKLQKLHQAEVHLNNDEEGGDSIAKYVNHQQQQQQQSSCVLQNFRPFNIKSSVFNSQADRYIQHPGAFYRQSSKHATGSSSSSFSPNKKKRGVINNQQHQQQSNKKDILSCLEIQRLESNRRPESSNHQQSRHSFNKRFTTSGGHIGNGGVRAGIGGGLLVHDEYQIITAPLVVIQPTSNFVQIINTSALSNNQGPTNSQGSQSTNTSRVEAYQQFQEFKERFAQQAKLISANRDSHSEEYSKIMVSPPSAFRQQTEIKKKRYLGDQINFDEGDDYLRLNNADNSVMTGSSPSNLMISNLLRSRQDQPQSSQNQQANHYTKNMEKEGIFVPLRQSCNALYGQSSQMQLRNLSSTKGTSDHQMPYYINQDSSQYQEAIKNQCLKEMNARLQRNQQLLASNQGRGNSKIANQHRSKDDRIEFKRDDETGFRQFIKLEARRSSADRHQHPLLSRIGGEQNGFSPVLIEDGRGTIDDSQEVASSHLKTPTSNRSQGFSREAKGIFMSYFGPERHQPHSKNLYEEAKIIQDQAANLTFGMVHMQARKSLQQLPNVSKNVRQTHDDLEKFTFEVSQAQKKNDQLKGKQKIYSKSNKQTIYHGSSANKNLIKQQANASPAKGLYRQGTQGGVDFEIIPFTQLDTKYIKSGLPFQGLNLTQLQENKMLAKDRQQPLKQQISIKGTQIQQNSVANINDSMTLLGNSLDQEDSIDQQDNQMKRQQSSKSRETPSQLFQPVLVKHRTAKPSITYNQQAQKSQNTGGGNKPDMQAAQSRPSVSSGVLPVGGVPASNQVPKKTKNFQMSFIQSEKTSPAKVKKKKPPSQFDNPHKSHKINQVISQANEFLIETFLRPNDQPVNVDRVKHICQQFFGIKLPRNFMNEPNSVKSKEFQIAAKEKILHRLYEVINIENQVTFDWLANAQQLMTRKFYVGKGNNYPLVRSILKQRWWWQLCQEGEDFNSCNFIWTSWRKNELLDFLKPNNQEGGNHDGKLRVYNRLEDNYHLSNKKALFFNMTQYYKLLGEDPFSILPLTFHIENGLRDLEFEKFKAYFQQIEEDKKARTKMLEKCKKQYMKEKRIREGYGSETESLCEEDEEEYLAEIGDDPEAYFGVRVPRNIWIMKPGENSNRGNGITVCSTLREIIAEINSAGKADHTHIIQKYIERPLLIHSRKFDIRVYGMLTSVNGITKGYFYEDGYIRTSCIEFDLEDLGNRFIHLTNDAVQKKSEDYGKFENGNKVSYQNFQKYIDTHLPPEQRFNFHSDILVQIRKIIADTFKATFMKLDPHRRQHSFEIFGYDFMIDESLKVYLIEANTNPCLELSCPLLARIIPAMLDSAFRIALDPLFPPRSDSTKKNANTLPEMLPINKFELVFDERLEGPKLRDILKDQEQFNLKIDVNEECGDGGGDGDAAEDENSSGNNTIDVKDG